MAKTNKGVRFSERFHNFIHVKHAIAALLKPRRRGPLTQ
jgi:hypothetical protein